MYTFWHRDFRALGYFGTEMFQHWDILQRIFQHMEVFQLGNFGTIQSNMYVSAQDILAPVPKCVPVPKHPFWGNIHVPKCFSAEMSLCRKVPVPKYPGAKMSLCQIVSLLKWPCAEIFPRWNVCAKMSLAKMSLSKMSGAEISPSLLSNQNCL